MSAKKAPRACKVDAGVVEIETVCVSVNVCERERERERGGGGQSARRGFKALQGYLAHKKRSPP